MSRALAMPVLGGAAAIAGLFVLARPAALRALLGMAEGDGATYGLRIAGAMLFALGLFLAGFTATLSLVRAG